MHLVEEKSGWLLTRAHKQMARCAGEAQSDQSVAIQESEVNSKTTSSRTRIDMTMPQLGDRHLIMARVNKIEKAYSKITAHQNIFGRFSKQRACETRGTTNGREEARSVKNRKCF